MAVSGPVFMNSPFFILCDVIQYTLNRYKGTSYVVRLRLPAPLTVVSFHVLITHSFVAPSVIVALPFLLPLCYDTLISDQEI
jgi:hypothetical protein